MKEDQGPSKCTRANSNKTKVLEEKEIDKLKAFVVKMNILADQVANLLKTP